MHLTWLLLLGSTFLEWKSGFSLAQIQYGPCRLPPKFPPGIQLYVKPFETAGRDIQIPYSYVATPRTSQDVVDIANWAYQTGYRVRATGSQHSWSPLTFSQSDSTKACPTTILVDTKRYFTSMIINPPDPLRPDLHSVSAGTGVELQSLLEFLEQNGLGIFSCPAIGAPTIGGMLAVGAHGSGVYSEYDKKSPGHSYGTFSNLVIQMTVVAWDEISSSYVLKTLHRSDTDTKAFLVNLGRTFVTSVILRVGKDQMLRSQSHFFISTDEGFSHPDDATESTRTYAKFVESYGRASFNILSPGKLIWVQTWHAEPMKPPKSRRTSRTMNYLFINFFPEIIDRILKPTLKAVPSVMKLISVIGNPYIVIGSYLSRSVDFWGPSKNHLIYVNRDYPRMMALPFTFVTSRKNVQLVLWIFRTHFDALSAEYEKIGAYPNPGISDIRITGLDNPKDIEIDGAESPSLSAGRPIPEYPDYDVVLWLDSTGYHNTPHFYEFMTRLQTLLYRDIHGKYAIIRAEWSKGWAATYSGAWSNETVLNHYARTFSTSDRLEEWNWAVRKLNSYDPHRIFSNDFLDNFLVEH